MAANRPEDCNLEIGKLISTGDIDAALDLYEPGAAFVPAQGAEPLVGSAAVRAALEGFAALKGTLDVKVRSVVQSGEVALLQSEWTLSNGKGPDGSAVNLAGKGAEVVRRQADGTWKFVVDNPFAGA
jgi:ketosteroid isomerase-like protein